MSRTGLRVNCLVSWFGIGPPRSHLRSDEDRDNRDEVEEREKDRETERERERECVCVLSAKEGRKLAPKDGLLHALLQKGKTDLLVLLWYCDDDGRKGFYFWRAPRE